MVSQKYGYGSPKHPDGFPNVGESVGKLKNHKNIKYTDSTIWFNDRKC